MISKKMLIPMAALAIVGAGVYGVTKVSAATDTTNPQASLIQKLADTFHVDKSKVQAVFDENHTQMEAQRETEYEARLTQAVTDGKLTSAQKDLVLTEHKKLKAEMDANRTAKSTQTQAERKAAMDKTRADVDAWAKANNIDAKWLIGGGGMGGHGHGGMMGGHGHDGDADDTATTTPTVSPSPSAAN